MIPEIDLKRKLELMSKEYGLYLREHIEQQISENINIMTCKSEVEMIGRQEAVKILKRLFSYINLLENPKGESERTSYR